MKKRPSRQAGHDTLLTPSQKKLRIIFNLVMAIAENNLGTDTHNKKIFDTYRRLWKRFETDENSAQG